MDRNILWLAQVCYAVCGLLTIRRLRAGGATPGLHRVNSAAMMAGFALHTAFLVMRGQTVKSCPLTNLFEVQAFIAWALVLCYLLIGSAYRVSFLGAFTAPVALGICLAGLLLATDAPRTEQLHRSGWVEFHAAIAIMAAGAFALAFVTSGMYLLQEGQLKTRRLTPSFLELPSIQQLDVINFRLLVMGFGMLTAGMIGGMISYRIVGHWTTPKIVWSVAAWVIYALLVAARPVWALRGRRAAVASMTSFVFVLATYWGVSLLAQ